MEAEIAILGGGLTGCAVAYYLGKRRRSVVLLERGFVGGESSGVNFGSLRLQGQSATDMPIALSAQAMWEGIEAELGESVEFLQAGHVHVAIAEAHLRRLEQNAAVAQAHGLPVEVLDRGEAHRRWPFLAPQVLAASWSAKDAVVNPRLVSPAFARAAIRHGVRIHENTEVTAIEHGNGRFTLRSTMNGRPGPLVIAERLVNAAGAWAGAVAEQFGETLPMFPAGPVEIVTEPVPRFVAPVIHAVDGSILFRQTAHGSVLIGGHPRIPVDAESRITRVPPEKMATNLARLVALVPGMAAHHVIRCWTGIEGYLPDMRPALGPSETTPGLYHAYAFSGRGLQLAPATAKALADLIVDGHSDAPIAPFAVGRFKSMPGTDAGPPVLSREEFTTDVVQGKCHD
jgi:sarcosine oxidase subunit beta